MLHRFGGVVRQTRCSTTPRPHWLALRYVSARRCNIYTPSLLMRTAAGFPYELTRRLRLESGSAPFRRIATPTNSHVRTSFAGIASSFCISPAKDRRRCHEPCQGNPPAHRTETAVRVRAARHPVHHWACGSPKQQRPWRHQLQQERAQWEPKVETNAF